MKHNPTFVRQRGFTLMETVIAIGVLSVLLTGFMIVFTPAAEGIRKSISIQEADRLVSALENELVTVKTNETAAYATGFAKAFEFIRDSTGPIANNQDTFATSNTEKALLVYQYRGSTSSVRSGSDGSPEPIAKIQGSAGDTYTLVPMMRKKSDPLFMEDLPAIEGSVYLVKCVQMVNVADADKPGRYALKPVPAPNPTGPKQRGSIYDPSPNSADDAIATSTEYPDAVIAFAAEFYPCPGKSKGFFDGNGFTEFYRRSVKPTFTRNLAIRR